MRIVTLFPVPANFRDDVAGPLFFVPSLSVCVCVRLLSVPRIIGPKPSISVLIASKRFCAASGVLWENVFIVICPLFRGHILYQNTAARRNPQKKKKGAIPPLMPIAQPLTPGAIFSPSEVKD